MSQNAFPSNQIPTLGNAYTSSSPFLPYFSELDPTQYNANFAIGKFWINTALGKLWFLKGFYNNPSNPGILFASWLLLSSASSIITNIEGNSGGVVTPDGSNIIYLLGDGTSMNVIGNPATHSLSIGFNLPILPSAGGTGVDNGIFTITLGQSFSTTGAFPLNLNVTGNTNVTLPTSGTLVNTSVTTLSSLVSVGTITTGTWNATPITVPYGGTNKTSFTPYCVITGGVTSTSALQNVVNTGTAGQLLTSNGPGALPTWQGAISGVTAIFGTANQIAASEPTGAVTLSLIGPYTPSNYTAHGVLLGQGSSSIVATSVGATGTFLGGNTGADPSFQALSGAVVTSITGTPNQINASASVGAVTLSLVGPYTPSTYTTHGILIGEGTSSIAATSAGTALQVMQSGGASADPNWSNFTILASFAQGDILYANAANTVIGLSKNTTATRYLANTGTTNNPAWDLINLTNGVQNTLQIANGGTGYGGSPVGGGIFYSGSTVGGLSAAPGSPNLILMSQNAGGGQFSPIWSSSTYPSSVTANNLLYASATNTVSGLATANSSALVTNGFGVPSWIPATAGQVIVGTTSSAPIFATIGSGQNITVTSSSGAISVAFSGTLPIANGGTNVTSVTTAPTATAFAGWDANKNLSANNFIAGYATTATAAATTTLTVSSAQQQYFTGTTTQTVKLPVTSTLVTGFSFTIVNNSTGVVTVTASDNSTIQAMASGTSLVVTCISTSDTSSAGWNSEYVQDTIVSVLGTTNQITSTPSSGTFTLSIPSTFIAPGSIAATTSISASSGTSSILGTVNINNTGTGVTTIGNPTGGTNLAGEVIITGTTSTTGTTLAVTGTQTIESSGTGVGNMFGVVSNNTFNPTLGANLVAAAYITPTFEVPTTKTVSTCVGAYISPGFASVNGTITTAYSMYVVAPPSQAGVTARYTAFLDTGVGIGQTNAVGGTYALAVTGGMQVTTGFLNLPTSTTANGIIGINGVSYFHNGGVATSVYAGPSAGHGTTATGADNAVYGGSAGAALTSGADLVLVGYQAGTALTTTGASGSVVIGSAAASTQTTAAKLTAIGYQALKGSSATGSNNTAIGYQALTAVTSAADCCAMGVSAGVAVTTSGASGGIFIGSSAGAGITTAAAPTIIGYQAASSQTTQNNLTAVGYQALKGSSATGTDNTAVGYLALTAATSIANAVCVGSNAGLALTTSGATGAVAIGSSALSTQTTAAAGTAVGYQALKGTAASGNNNTGIGYQAGTSVTSCADGTFIGYTAGAAVTTSGASGSTFIGSQSGVAITSGGSSTGVGYQSVATQTTASSNTGVGYQALKGSSASGSSNTAVGYQAGAAVTSSGSLTLCGAGAGSALTSGNNHCHYGVNAGASLTTSDNTAAFGLQALQFNTGTGNCAFGVNSLRGTNGSSTGGNNTCYGTSSGLAITTGAFNIIIGSGAGANITTGGGNVLLTPYAGTTSLGNTIIIGFDGNRNASQTHTYIDGIQNNTTTGSTVLVNSDGTLAPLASSRRYKKNIEDMTSDLSQEIYKLRPRCFNYISEKTPIGNEKYDQSLQPGLIAEEVEETSLKDMLVSYLDNGQVQSVHYYKLPVLLLNEIQKHKNLIDSLLTRIQNLENLLKV